MEYSDTHTHVTWWKEWLLRKMNGRYAIVFILHRKEKREKKERCRLGLDLFVFFFHYRAAQVQERAEYLCTLSSKGCFLAMPWCIRNNVIHFFHFFSAVETHCLFSLFSPTLHLTLLLLFFYLFITSAIEGFFIFSPTNHRRILLNLLHYQVFGEWNKKWPAGMKRHELNWWSFLILLGVLLSTNDPSQSIPMNNTMI